MHKQLVTQCPSCQTRFELTPDELQAADGIVRCGRCDAIFSAPRHLETQATAPAAASSGQPQSEPPALTQSPLSVEREPILLRRPQRRARWRSLFWFFAMLLSALAAGAQIGWFERDRLAHEPMLAPVYAWLCSRLPCQTGARQDLGAISSEKLLIRDHPEYKQALLMDLLLENHAPFEQPFPALKLVFLTLDGRPTAARILQPELYLGGEFARDALMPVNTAVQIRLELEAPAEPSPGYRLELIPAQRGR